MSIAKLGRGLFAAVLLMTAAGAIAQDAVRISEFHYDNAGVDSGEAIEVSSPEGFDLTGWQVVLYNGNNGAPYDSRTLSSIVTAACGARQVTVLGFPANGIQNGPDGIALVDPAGTLVEFLSYEGVFAATAGPALDATSTDIGTAETGTEPLGQSVARNAAGEWRAPAANTFGRCNDRDEQPSTGVVASVTIIPSSVTINVGQSFTLLATAFDENGTPIEGVNFAWSSNNGAVVAVNDSGVVTGIEPGGTIVTVFSPNGLRGNAFVAVQEAPPPPQTDFRVNEIHYDNVGVDVGEAIEIEGAAGTDLTGFNLVLYDGSSGAQYDSLLLNGTLPASCDARGVLVVTLPAEGLQNGSPDGIALVTPTGEVLEFVSYEGTFTATTGAAADMTSVDIGAAENPAAVGSSLQRTSTGVWVAGASSFGACNSDTPDPVVNSLAITGRTATDPPLPVGFEDQLFATLRSPANVVIPTAIAWSSDTPDVASVDQRGVIHALTEGTAIFRATAEDGTTATWPLPTRVAVAGASAQYGGNTEFGVPQDADSSDDYVVTFEQYTSSFNPNRGTPNWVSYDLDASHFGDEDGCNCFTMDASLPSSFTQLSTADYTGASAFHGYGIDRGHLARSSERTAGSLDNARAYLFDNVFPQAADQNEGPWAALETYLGDLARLQDKEIYVVAGVAGNKGTVKNEGKIVIPEETWKVALILPRDHGLADVRDYRDVQAIAVIMPNEPGVRDVPWQTYQTTVDAVEALSGYDLFAALADKTEVAVESNTQPPLAAFAGPGAAISEGDSAGFSAADSIDPNGTIESYVWDFGDGSGAEGAAVSHVYPHDGEYAVHLTITDNDGLVDTASRVVSVHNVVPVVAAIPNGSVSVGTSYTVAGTFTDPGTDTWTATASWGDGNSSTVTLGDRTFSLSHTYVTAGNYTVTVEIADDDSVSSASHTVAVSDPAPDLASALSLIDQLVAARKLDSCVGAVLKAEVNAARGLIANGKKAAAIALLRGMVAEIDLLVRLRVAKKADLAPLRAIFTRTIASLGG